MGCSGLTGGFWILFCWEGYCGLLGGFGQRTFCIVEDVSLGLERGLWSRGSGLFTLV